MDYDRLGVTQRDIPRTRFDQLALAFIGLLLLATLALAWVASHVRPG